MYVNEISIKIYLRKLWPAQRVKYMYIISAMDS